MEEERRALGQLVVLEHLLAIDYLQAVDAVVLRHVLAQRDHARLGRVA